MSLAPTSKARRIPSDLERPLRELKGVGSTTAQKLRGLGLQTTGDLLLHLPFRHESAATVSSIATLPVGVEAVIRVRVDAVTTRETVRRRVKVLEALVSDDSGSLVAVWYNQAYLEAAFREHPEVLLKGVLQRRHGALRFFVKRHEIMDESGESLHILGLVPVYPSTGDLSVRTIRNLVHQAAPFAQSFVDPLPSRLLAERRYPRKAEALLASHFPSSLAEARRARDRLAFEELLLLQVAVMLRRRQQDSSRHASPFPPRGGSLTAAYLQALPYQPTRAQMRVIGEIDADLARPVPMRRLLHGEVGSGKTMVATYCMLRAIEEGGQALLMAPTEVLVDQHYLELSQRLSPLGVRVGVLKGSQPVRERREIRKAAASGEADLLVGTHALIQEGVRFHDLRVAVVDEQHRFGVRQRDAVVAPGAGGAWPHALHMSATPIPRTLSLTLYGDLEVSTLDEVPPGRSPVSTRLVFPEAEAKLWEFVRHQLDRGRQAYVVCPLIDEGESLQAASATQTFNDLAGGELSGYRLRLLHGGLSAAVKAETMAAYSSGAVDVLVSTTVIEVGVDVPNATVMIIMGARRFGLSQLHQLRGRVGRGTEKSYCFLLADREDEDALQRMAVFARTSDGFALAEADLAARGEGQLFGERQSGLGDFRIASLLRDRHLLEEARRMAKKIVDAAAQGETSLYEPLLEAAEQQFGVKLDWFDRL